MHGKKQQILYFREKLQIEIKAREQAEKKQIEYEERLKAMQQEMERRQKGEKIQINT